MEQRKKYLDEISRKPVSMLFACELVDLIEDAVILKTKGTQTTVVKRAYGYQELATWLGCSPAKIYDLKKSGVLKDCIVSAIGKKTIFDVDKAREEIAAYNENSGRKEK